MRYFWFAYGQFTLYCVAKLLNHWAKTREDAEKNNFADKLIFAAWVVCITGSFPLCAIAALVDMPSQHRLFRREQQLARFVHHAAFVESLSPEKRQKAATFLPYDPDWDFDQWIKDGLLPYGIEPEDAGFFESDLHI